MLLKFKTWNPELTNRNPKYIGVEPRIYTEAWNQESGHGIQSWNLLSRTPLPEGREGVGGWGGDSYITVVLVVPFRGQNKM